jgi:His-Xaa-Ser system protein HxsD
MGTRSVVVKNQARLTINEKVYNKAVVMAAAYVFLDRCYVRLERTEKKKIIRVLLKGKKRLTKRNLTKIEEEFFNELLHQCIRHQVSKTTGPLREILVGRALMSAEGRSSILADNLDDELDYRKDPLGIAIPWEKKYGKDKEKV